jgi:hypothetical protein
VPYEQRGKRCVAILGNKEVYGVMAATGQVQWTASWKTMYDESIPDAVIGGDKLFMSSGLGTGAALFEILENRTTFMVWTPKMGH